MSVRVLSWVWDHSEAEATDRLVLLAIADNAGDDGQAFPGLETLARKTRLHRRTVQRSIATLRKLGELEVGWNEGGKEGWRKDRRPNLFTVVGYTGRQAATPASDGMAESASRGGGDVPDGVAPVSPKPSLNHQEPRADARRPAPSERRLAGDEVAKARKRLAAVPRRSKRQRRRAS